LAARKLGLPKLILDLSHRFKTGSSKVLRAYQALQRNSPNTPRRRKNRDFSSSVVVTLGLGIGSTVSVFSIIYAVIARPLPFADPAHLGGVFQSKLTGGRHRRRPCSFTDTLRRNRTQFGSRTGARSRKPLRSHEVVFKTLWLSNCSSFHIAMGYARLTRLQKC
jgi:hypothetical protein